MDFATVKNQLRSGHYATPDEFAEDVRLVFYNTRIYNPPTDDIVLMANALELAFDERFKAIKTDVFDEDGDSLKDKVSLLENNLKKAKEEIKNLRKASTVPATATSPVSPATPGKPKGRTPKEDNRIMTFDEKRRLSMNINKLPAEKLGKVIQIIHERSPKLAQSSAPDEIEIDIDALDTVTLRNLERYAKSILNKDRKSSAVGASLSRKQQVDLTASGTQEKIKDVERQLNELNRSLGAKTPGKRGGKKKTGESEDVVIDDNVPAENYPTVHIEKDATENHSDSSDSESSSESSDSESSSSDSDSDSSATSSASSDSENKNNPNKKRSVQKDPATGGQTTLHHPTSRPAITNTDQSKPTDLNNHTSSPLSAPPPNSPPMQPHQEKVIFTLEKPVHTPPTSSESSEVAPEIKQSTSSKKAPDLPTTVMASWTSLLDTSTTHAQESTPPSDPMWSQFQNKNIQQKQKEKEREEQEEQIRREREEREEEKKREEERKRKEAEEAELKRQRDTEAENEQKKQALMAQRAAARAAREMIVGKNMTEQSNLMASFENETRTQQSSLLDLHLKPVDVKGDQSPTKPNEVEEGEL